MKSEYKIRHLEENGYKVTHDMASGRIVVTRPNGFAESFRSVSAAHKRFFNY